MILAVLLCSVKLLKPVKADGLSSDRVGPGELLEQAEAYVVEGQYEQAAAIYNSIIADDQVDMQGQVLAHGGLIVVSVHREEITAAEAALESLLTNYDDEAAVSAAVYNIAHAFSATRPDKALTLFQQILDTWPDFDEAIWVQVEVVKLNLDLQNETAAQSAYQKLISQFYGHEDTPVAVCDLADVYIEFSPEKTIELCEYALEQWPNAPDVMWMQVNMTCAYLRLKNDAAAKAVYQNLLSQFSDHENLPEAMYSIADCYMGSNQPKKVVELYEYATTRWPDYDKWTIKNDLICFLRLASDAYLVSGNPQKALELCRFNKERFSGTEDEIWFKTGMVRSHINLGDDSDDQQLNELLTDFFGHPKLHQAIFCVAEQYYIVAAGYEAKGNADKARQCLQKAITLWKNIPEDSDLSGLELLNEDRHFMIAETYRRLGQDKEAAEHYKKVVATKPDHQQAPHIYFMIGKGYERLKKAKIFSASSADIEIERYYQKAVESDPDSPAAKNAAKRLKKLSSTIKGD